LVPTGERWGSLTIPALWHLLKGFFIFTEKEGFFKIM